jgi:hypothetical protein
VNIPLAEGAGSLGYRFVSTMLLKGNVSERVKPSRKEPSAGRTS